ncbi:MAG: hypothetical protein ACRENJ_06785, partial [Candidatus Eiseniibacteriota bacterium]
ERLAVEADGRGAAVVAWTTPDDIDPAPHVSRWSPGGPGHEVEIDVPPGQDRWDSTRLALVTDGRGGALMAWSGWVADTTQMRAVVRVATHRATGEPR